MFSRACRVLFVLLLAANAALATLASLKKPFWFDELFTVYAGRLLNSGRLWQALYDGLDAMPPAFHGINALCAAVMGDPHLAYRLPAIAGWLLALSGVYSFARQVRGPAAGLASAAILAIMPVSSYGSEARPYGLLLGVTAWAMACWLRENRHRWLLLLLPLAASLHYLAPLAVACFALAEAAHYGVHRRVRRTVWLALALSLIPVVLTLPILLHARAESGAQHWARPDIRGIPYYYGNLLGLPLYASLAAIPTGLALAAYGANRKRAEFLLLLPMLMLPLMGLGLALLSGGAFADRYAIPVVLAAALLVPLSVPLNSSRVEVLSAAGLSLAVMWFTVTGIARLFHVPPAAVAGRQSPLLAAARNAPGETLPIVFANSLDFFPTAHYAEPALASRLFCLADKDAAGRLGGTSDNARLMLTLHRYASLNIASPEQFIAAHPRFYVLSSGLPRMNWLPAWLAERGYRFQRQPDSPLRLAEP
ncbi:MAG: glycosyltransferase family 39 protein [Candidatus Solibacter usitatus]|nr:glycosyltransferase family 39 protein [Candidatus Solibacter usitatus]